MKLLKIIGHGFNKYINGVKGAVSILLTLVMLPFLSTALIIVESSRYQNAIELVDEFLDCLGLSTIAEYDSYLEKRFGLLAMDQGANPATDYQKYFDANVGALSNSFKHSSSTVKGVYPLSNNAVLKEQLLNYSEVPAVIESVYNGLSIKDLISELEKYLGLEDLNKIANATSKVAGVASSTADFVDAIKTTITEFDEYKAQRSEYNTAASSFHSSASSLITALNNSTAEDIYKDKAVKDAVKDCEKKRDTFKTEAGEMATAVDEMKTALDSISAKADSITNGVNDVKTGMDKVTGTTLKEDCTTSAAEWVITVANMLTSTLKKSTNIGYGDEMIQQAASLRTQQSKLKNVVCDKASDGDTSKYFIDKSKSAETVKSDFAAVKLNSVNMNFGDMLGKIITTLDNEKAAVDKDESVGLGKLLDMAGELLKVTAFYDGVLDSNVATTSFYKYDASGISFTSQAIITAITKVLGSGQDFVDGLCELNILKALKAVGTFLEGIVTFLVSIVAWVTTTIGNVIQLFSKPAEIYDTYMLSAYAVYNLPCRTTFDSGKTLCGSFSYGSLFTRMGGVSGDKVTGSLKDLQTLVSNPGSGKDPGFKGAEAEYVMIGSANELLNQSAAFFNIYMLRMIFNLFTIFGDNQVKLMAGSATVAGWVVYLALIIAEPMIDTLLIVNGSSEYMVKKFAYLTPMGMIGLGQQLPNLTGLPATAKQKINDALTAKDGKFPDNGKVKIKMNYQAHLMVLMFLTVKQSNILSRIGNVVHMEAANYYKGTHDFKLDKANTYLKATVSGSLNSMFDLEALTKDGPFSITRTRYIGY